MSDKLQPPPPKKDKSLKPLRSGASVSYLPEFLIEVRGVDLSFLVSLLVVKVQIPADEKGSHELLHLHRNVERDGDDEVIKDQKCQEIWDELQDLEEDTWSQVSLKGGMLGRGNWDCQTHLEK